VGLVPVVWSWVKDLSDGIWIHLGFFFFVFLCSLAGHGGEGREGLKTPEKTTVSVNKQVAFVHLSWWCSGVLQGAPTGRGGEGSGFCRAPLAPPRGWEDLLLPIRANHMAAVVVAMIWGQKDGPIRRHGCVSSTSRVEALSGTLGRSSPSSPHQVVRPRRRHGGRLPRFIIGGEDKGPDCFFCFSFRVLFAYLQDFSVIFFSSCPVVFYAHRII
jgi:hypothetical protein